MRALPPRKRRAITAQVRMPEPLPSLVYGGLQPPCIVAVPQPEPVFSWHSGGYTFCDSIGAVVARA